MSERPRFPAMDALKIAKQFASALSVICERVEIAGSLRRQKPTVGDIEILFIPHYRTVWVDMFEPTEVSKADILIGDWLQSGFIQKRPSKIGVFTWGPENKLAIHQSTGIPVDFFATTQEKWWNALVCRTGGKDSNLRLTNTALSKGYSFEAYGAGFKNLNGGSRHDSTSERDVFEFIGLPYLEPRDRP